MNNFHCHTSNRLETLAGIFRRKVHHQPPPGLFEPEVIVVQTQGMAAWLKFQLADEGVAANIDTPFLANFISRTLQAVFGAEFRADIRATAPRVNRWKICARLEENALEYPEPGAYIAGDSPELKRWQLACRTADFFDQYQVYRPELPQGWRAGKVLPRYDWQRRLYLEVNAGHATLDEYFRRFAGLTELPAGTVLPRRVSVFGAGAMPPEFFGFFYHLSRHTEVHFFYLNPCREFWAYQFNRKEVSFRLEEQESAAPGNPLLAAFGTQGRNFFHMVLEQLPELSENFVDYVRHERYNPDSYSGASVLTAMQQDILNMYDRGPHADGETVGAPMPVAPEDRSVEIHNCHSRRREVEVLHDRLLELLQDGAIQPRDIIVTAPDVNLYASYIDAIFGQGPLANVYAISDRGLRETGVITNAVMRLLALAKSKFTASEIFSLLDIAPLRRKFELSEADLPEIHDWLDAAGIRWGIDGRDREEACEVAFEEYSWQQGLDRLLMGFARSGGGETLFADGIAGVDCAEGTDAVRLGNFVEFARRLFALRDALQGRRRASEWFDLLRDLVQKSFHLDNDSREEIAAILRAIQELRDQLEAAEADPELPLEVIAEVLANALAIPAEYEPFLRGKITFCSMVPMRSIPMKVVVLLGLNDGEFPRRDTRSGFHLLSADPRYTDRSRQAEDRYLFLEALLSARKCLLLFYQGQSPRGDELRPPAPPLKEVIDYLERGFQVRERRERLQPFDFRYFDRNAPDSPGFSFSEENFNAARTLAKALSTNIFHTGNALPPPSEEALPAAVGLDELERFFANPCAWYLEHKSKVLFPEHDDALLKDTEPLEFDALADYLLKTEIGGFTVRELPRQVQYELLRRNCRLPVGAAGTQEFERLHRLIGNIPPEWLERMRKRERHLVDLQLANCRICGFAEGAPDGAETWFATYSGFRYKYAVRAYLRQLALAAQGSTSVAGRMLSIDQGLSVTRELPRLGKREAEAELTALLEIFRRGQSRPLPLFPLASFAYATTSGDAERKRKAARSAFAPAFKGGFDLADEAIGTCFGVEIFDDDRTMEEFAELSGRILAPFQQGAER